MRGKDLGWGGGGRSGAELQNLWEGEKLKLEIVQKKEDIEG